MLSCLIVVSKYLVLLPILAEFSQKIIIDHEYIFCVKSKFLVLNITIVSQKLSY